MNFSLAQPLYFRLEKNLIKMKFYGIGSRVKHPEFGAGVVLNVRSDYYLITFIDFGEKRISLDQEMEVIEYIEPEKDYVSLYDVEQSVARLLQKWMGVTEIVLLGEKWKGGKMILMPGRSDVQSKELPIDTFFHKIVMMRDRLRVIEQKVNASGLDDEAKVDIQQYISRCYGSMTTFNILFKEKDQQFVGAK